MDDNQLMDFTIDPRDLAQPEQSQQTSQPEKPLEAEKTEEIEPATEGFNIDVIPEPAMPQENEPAERAPEPEALPQTAEDEPGADAAVLNGRIEALEQANAKLTDIVDKMTAQAQQRSELFDKMYNELQSYKNDIYGKLLKPFVLSTLSLLEDTNRFIERLGEGDVEKAANYLRSIPDDLIDILEVNGVILYEDESDVFNPRTQRSVKQVPTADLSLNNKVAKRVRPGYNWNGTNLRPETVWIYKYDANAAAPEQSASNQQ